MHNILLATPFIAVIGGDGRACQKVMPESCGVINIVANRIPELWNVLPFVNKPRLLSLQEFGYVHRSLCEIPVTPHRIRHVQNAFSLLFTGSRLAAPFGSLDKNRA